MKKYFYFRDATDEDNDDDVSASIMVPVEDIRGVLPTTTTNLDLYYLLSDKTTPNTTGGTGAGTGKVSLTCTRGKMLEVMASLASHGNATKPFTGGSMVMVDDATTGYAGETQATSYFHPDVTACTITVA